MPINLLEEAKRLKTLADTGQLYAENDFDRERYEELLAMSFRMMSAISGHPEEDFRQSFAPVQDYPTPKTDVRGILLSPDKNQVLLVKESADGRWALPGGWAEIGFSPKEVMVKEFQEETGIDVEVIRLLAVWDKRKHNHPAETFYVYKLFFYCVATSSDLSHGHDMLGVGFFDMAALPPLSEDRNTRAQIERLYQKVITGDVETDFDR